MADPFVEFTEEYEKNGWVSAHDLVGVWVNEHMKSGGGFAPVLDSAARRIRQSRYSADHYADYLTALASVAGSLGTRKGRRMNLLSRRATGSRRGGR